MKTETIDITPTWKSLIRPLLDGYSNTKSVSTKNDIVNELERLAEIVDNMNRAAKNEH